NTRIDKQSDRFKESQEANKKISAEAKQFEFRRNQLKSQVDKLKAQTDKVEKKSVASKERRNQARTDIRNLEKEKAALVVRMRQADLAVTRLNKQIKDLNNTRRRVSHENRQLSKKVATAEGRVEQLKSQVR